MLVYVEVQFFFEGYLVFLVWLVEVGYGLY